MKKIFFVAVMMFSFWGFLLADNSNFMSDPTTQNADFWGNYGSDPKQILDSLAGKANQDFSIQETKLDTVSNLQGGFARQNKISNTLDSIRLAIAPYLQWALYLGLSIAVILIIWNGFQLVTAGASGDEGVLGKVKKRMTYIVIGVIVLTGFYFIIKLVLSVLANLTT